MPSYYSRYYSLCYELRCHDAYKDMKTDLQFFDTRDYPTNHSCFSKINSKVLGKFKDECSGVTPLEFVGLRAKIYSILMPDQCEKKTGKGINSRYLKKHIHHQMYLDCLETEHKTSACFYCIQRKNHQLRTVMMQKVALNPYDDKRYLLSSTHTLAYGHYSLPRRNK